MSLLRPMAKPSLERGSVNVTLTSLYVWINHKLQVASKSIAFLSNRTNSWNIHGDVDDDDGDVDGVGGKVCGEEFAKEVACSPRRLPFPFLNNRRALSICSLPLFSLCISFAFPPIPPTGSLLLKCFLSLFLLFPSPVSCLLLPFFSSFTPSLLHPICLIIGPLSIDSSSKGKHTSIGECISWQRSHWSNAPFSIASSYNLDSCTYCMGRPWYLTHYDNPMGGDPTQWSLPAYFAYFLTSNSQQYTTSSWPLFHYMGPVLLLFCIAVTLCIALHCTVQSFP